MKTKYLYLLLTFLTLSSCSNVDDFLDVVPTGRVIPTTLEDFDKMIQDYAILRSTGLNVRFMDPDVYHNEITFPYISNNIVDVNAYTWQHDIFTLQDSDGDYSATQTGFYYFIHVMNTVLQDVDDAPAGNFNPVNRNNLKAEALAQRANQLFMAVNEYAHHYDPANPDLAGVPMPLKVDLQASLGKSTVKEVYDQIISDLNQALNLFSDGYPAINTGANYRPGKVSIYALLAEVYLYMGDFEAAKTSSNKALALYNFLYDYNDADFANPSAPWSGYTEPYKTDWGVGTLNKEVLWHRYIEWGFTYPYRMYSPDLVSLFDKDNDRRWYLFATQTSSNGNIDVSPNDYLYMYARSERCNGFTVPRLMLTNAEAKARTNDGAGAIQVLNNLLTNRISNFVQLTHTDNAVTLQLIKDERRKELAGSSLNLYDQKRYYVYGETVPTYTRTNPVTGESFSLAPGDDGYVVKISPAVRELNPNLN